MARGWDSKAIEDQQSAAEAEKSRQSRPELSAGDRDVQSKRQGLTLARAKILADLDAASDPRYRTMLSQALAHIDSEIDALPAKTASSRVVDQ